MAWGKSDIFSGKKRKGLPATEIKWRRLGKLALVDVGTLAAAAGEGASLGLTDVTYSTGWP